MVITENKCEMRAIPAASDVSLPYAAGITIPFKPIGTAAKQVAHLKKVGEKKELCGKSTNTPIKISGYTTVLIADSA